MSLEKFKKFSKRPVEQAEVNKDVWIYTRVSSKDQEMNKSLSNQKIAANEYADENDLNISEVYGGTYESASGDFTRAEFRRLIEAVKKVKKRPYAVLIYTMSRFSRTGGGGISQAHELVEKMGVHLIEVSTGKTTATEQGKNDVYASLLRANQDNIDRKKACMPGMKTFVKSGGWTGKAPRGYDTYGKKVRKPGMLSLEHRIEMNEEGKKLKLAWQWKLAREKDSEIIKKLENLGVHMTKQAISVMWRRPFYAGINVNKILDEPVKGNWEPMVTEEEFLRVQDILDGHRVSGYTVEKDNNRRPLNLFLRCSKCEEKMTGYEVKKKKLHYYKCQTCKNATINADTGKKSKGMGAHDMFKSVLSLIRLDESLIEPFKQQLNYTYESLNKDQSKEKAHLLNELKIQTEKLNVLKKRFAFGEIDKSIYDEFSSEQIKKIDDVSERIEKLTGKISNLENYIDISVDVVQNLNKYWEYESVESKRRIQNVVFPEGLMVDTEKRQYLTKKINSVFTVSGSVSAKNEKKKSDSENVFPQKSLLVAGTGLEPVAFGL